MAVPDGDIMADGTIRHRQARVSVAISTGHTSTMAWFRDPPLA
jgi:hypothetical protein